MAVAYARERTSSRYRLELWALIYVRIPNCTRLSEHDLSTGVQPKHLIAQLTGNFA